jgi:molybdopterin-guanine dinucleotide biosynthesis protein B
MSNVTPVSVVGLVGSSGSGKTTLLERMLPVLGGAGWRVAVIKHAGPGFDLEEHGKDSYRVREAGAAQVLVASRDRWALLVERLDSRDEPSLDELIARFDPTEIDLILVEGFAQGSHPKIEVYRPAHGRAPVSWPADPSVVAVATDAPIETGPDIVRLDLNRPDSVAAFITELVTARTPPASHSSAP